MDACLAKAEMEFALMANSVFQGACLCEADMSGTVVDGAVLTRADLRKANLRGAGFRDARLDQADLRDARLGVPSWPGLRYAVPICAGRICVWPSSTAPTCPMPVWKLSKA